MSYGDEKIKQIENEILNMQLSDLIYLDLNPHSYVCKKLEKEIQQTQALGNKVQSKYDSIQRQKISVQGNEQLMSEIEKLSNDINQLLKEKQKLSDKKKCSRMFENKIKEIFRTPEDCFKDFKDGKMNLAKFKEQFAEMGKGENYYYYKIINDKIKNC